MNMWIKRDDAISSITDLAVKNTGMSLSQLQNDTTKYHYAGLSSAVDLFLDHISRGDKIIVHGDYDTDGVMSLAVMTELFRQMHLSDARLYAPCRFKDGYGLKVKHVDEYLKDGCNLLITVDNGIAAVDAIKKARENGMDVIVLDHHEPFAPGGKVILPDANIIVDPHITKADFDDLCGAGLALLFAKEVFCRLKYLSTEVKRDAFARMKAYAAIATVGDVVSLTKHNRLIVKKGLDMIGGKKASVGLQTLLEVLYIEYADTETIGFTLSPIINASGRLYEDGASFVLNIVTQEQSSDQLISLCEELIRRNEERKEKTKIIVAEATEMVEACKDDPVIVIAPKSCTIGLAGLVAGSLTETYHKPSIVLAEFEGSLKGSGRSVEGFNIKEGLDQCSDLLISYGGHALACGLSIEPEDLAELATRLQVIAPTSLMTDQSTIFYDLEDTVENIRKIIQEQNAVAPFGEGNEKPVFLFRNIDIPKTFFMGKEKQHVKLMTAEKDTSIVWFDGANAYKEMGSPKSVDVLATVGINIWKGNLYLQLQAIDVRKAT